MKRIGILGGTFNPIHTGHLGIADGAREKLKLDKVIFIPSFRSPHKSGANVIAAKDRYRMTALAIKGNKRFEVSDFEIRNKEKSYTINTVKYLKKKYPKGTKFFIIIGGDLVPTLHRWKKIEELRRHAVFIAAYRKGYRRTQTKNKVRIFEVPGLEISSSDIRRKIANGQSVRYLLPEAVLKYIQKNKLY